MIVIDWAAVTERQLAVQSAEKDLKVKQLDVTEKQTELTQCIEVSSESHSSAAD